MTTLRARLYRQLDGNHVGHDGMSALNVAIAILITVAVVLSVLATEPAVVNAMPYFFKWAEMFFGLFFLAEYSARAWVAAEAPGPQGAWAHRLAYVTSLRGVIDLIVVLIAVAPLVSTELAALTVLRLLRILVLVRLGSFSPALREIMTAIWARRYDLMVVMVLTALLILLGATALYFAEAKVQPEKFGSVPRAMWWAVVTVATVGYGDSVPITPLGKVMGAFVALAGIGLFAMPTGIFAAAFSEAMQRRRGAEADKEDVS